MIDKHNEDVYLFPSSYSIYPAFHSIQVFLFHWESPWCVTVIFLYIIIILLYFFFIKKELNVLNQTSAEINKLENELDVRMSIMVY